MKNISIAIFCLISIGLSAQNYDFAVGVTLQPFLYKNYNKSDWNNMPQSYPNQPKTINGYAIGLATDTPISDRFSVKAELAYSKQNQKHILVAAHEDYSDGTIEYFYGWILKAEFDILKLPLMLSYNIELGFKRGLYLNVFGGPQLSNLLDYKLIHANYEWDFINNQITDFIRIETVQTPGVTDQMIWDRALQPPAYRQNKFESKYLYNQWLWGAVGGVELKKNISSNISIGLGGRFEYDFTSSDKYSDEIGGWTLQEGGSRGKSHNVRVGMSLNVMYQFD